MAGLSRDKKGIKMNLSPGVIRGGEGARTTAKKGCDMGRKTSELQREIQNAMGRLGQGVDTGDTEAAARAHLRAAVRSISGSPRRLEGRIADLRRFWLESVPWCSPLSKDLEKIITLYSEAVADGEL